MNEEQIEQLKNWHKSSEHSKIIQTIEEFPVSELNFELKSLLARAYNNVSDYQKALQILLPESAQGADDALWNFRVGYAYYYNNELEKALPYFQKSAALGYTTAVDFKKWCISDIERKNPKITEEPENLDNKWFDFTMKFVDKLSENGNDWDAISEKEQELAPLWKLEMDMHNGGFIQFFCNWGYKCYQSLDTFRSYRVINILQQQYKIIQHLENNKEIKELWEIPKFLTNEEITEINDVLHPKYWDNNDNIIEKTFNIYSEFLDNTKKQI